MDTQPQETEHDKLHHRFVLMFAIGPVLAVFMGLIVEHKSAPLWLKLIAAIIGLGAVLGAYVGWLVLSDERTGWGQALAEMLDPITQEEEPPCAE